MNATNLVDGSGNGNESLLDVLGRIARLVSDGHYTICAFTTNYRVCFGTPDGREDIGDMPLGRTIEEAVRNAIDALCGREIPLRLTPRTPELTARYEVAIP